MIKAVLLVAGIAVFNPALVVGAGANSRVQMSVSGEGSTHTVLGLDHSEEAAATAAETQQQVREEPSKPTVHGASMLQMNTVLRDIKQAGDQVTEPQLAHEVEALPKDQTVLRDIKQAGDQVTESQLAHEDEAPPKDQATQLQLAQESSKAPAIKCPKSGAMVHAHSQVEVTADKKCSTIIAEMKARVSEQGKKWIDPHNNGTYTLTSATDDELDMKRVTGNGKYTDKMIFKFEETKDPYASKGIGCHISGCSASQVFSIADFSTNYCNLRMMYCSKADGCKPVTKDAKDVQITEMTVKSSTGASHDPDQCLKVTQERRLQPAEAKSGGYQSSPRMIMPLLAIAACVMQ